MDWRLAPEASDMLRFVREMIALRKRHPGLRRRRFLTGCASAGRQYPDVAWHGERLDEPAWHDGSARLLAFTLAGEEDGEQLLHIILNMDDCVRTVALPSVEGRRWRRIVDTALPAPQDIVSLEKEAVVESERCRVQARSVVVLEEGGGG
jgi:glycogen operon protein